MKFGKRKKNRTFKHVWTIKTNGVQSRLEFQVGLKALNQSAANLIQILDFVPPTYTAYSVLHKSTKKYKKTPTLLINLHDLFHAHTFIWSTRLCVTLEHNFAV